jgi:DNA-3-methyladenine glycosylase I
MICRCAWAEASELERVYHDTEWGVPLHEDRALFEFLILEGAQAGLSWRTVLARRENYRAALGNFEPARLVTWPVASQLDLVNNAGLIRHRLKLQSIFTNAAAFLQIQAEYGSFDAYLWRFVDGKPQQPARQSVADIPAVSTEATALSRDLSRRGFKFVGPRICYAYMQAVGMVNDHTVDCFRFDALAKFKSF